MRRLLGLAAALVLISCGPPEPKQSEPEHDDALESRQSALRSATLPECRRRFRMVMDKPLSLRDFASLAGPETVSMDMVDGGRLSLAYRAFDYEELPLDGDRQGVGVVYVRDEQTGGAVAGGVIWASGVEMGASGGFVLERRSGQGLFLKLTPLDGLEGADSSAPCRGSYDVRLDEERVLYVDGVKVGVLK